MAGGVVAIGNRREGQTGFIRLEILGDGFLPPLKLSTRWTMIDVAPETALNRFVGQRVAGGQMDDRPDVFGFCDFDGVLCHLRHR